MCSTITIATQPTRTTIVCFHMPSNINVELECSIKSCEIMAQSKKPNHNSPCPYFLLPFLRINITISLQHTDSSQIASNSHFLFVYDNQSSMTNMFIVIRVCIWVMGSRNSSFSLQIVVKLLCPCLCLFDAIVKLHAMDKKKFIDLLIGKQKWNLYVRKAYS